MTRSIFSGIVRVDRFCGYLDAYGELAGRHGKLAYRVALRLVGNHFPRGSTRSSPAAR
jgi:hypothetical protein